MKQNVYVYFMIFPALTWNEWMWMSHCHWREGCRQSHRQRQHCHWCWRQRKCHHQVYQLSLSECKNQSTNFFFFRINVKTWGSLFLCFLVRHTCEMWSSAGGRAGTRGRARAAAGDSTRTTNCFTVATVKALYVKERKLSIWWCS